MHPHILASRTGLCVDVHAEDPATAYEVIERGRGLQEVVMNVHNGSTTVQR